ncbi:hypothetical protein D9757_013884 [Collybiopsis confluens]|uniref:Uncharacterized protein n=1 Tax=Collybiopsis confluens TaxID=2823264 RepID=A0A8H5CNU4_9AGAR|nr:hypothetical protein D9757_013884 [Collybiopsis confluens]
MSFFAGAHHFSVGGRAVLHNPEGSYVHSSSSRQRRNDYHNSSSSRSSSNTYRWPQGGRRMNEDALSYTIHDDDRSPHFQGSRRSNNSSQSEYTRTTVRHSTSGLQPGRESRRHNYSTPSHSRRRNDYVESSFNARDSANRFYEDNDFDEEDFNEDFEDFNDEFDHRVRRQFRLTDRNLRNFTIFGGTFNAINVPRGGMVNREWRGDNDHGHRHSARVSRPSSSTLQSEEESPHDPDYPRVPDPEFCSDPPPSYLESFKDVPASPSTRM